MELRRANFRFNRQINLREVIASSSVFYMEQEDINEDRVVSEEHLEDSESLIVFQNTNRQYENERYCYIKLNTLVGLDGNTKQISIEKIIVDTNLIQTCLFDTIFIVLLQQENNEFNNRIVISNSLNECFRGRIVECARRLSYCIYNLFCKYTSDDCSTYRI